MKPEDIINTGLLELYVMGHGNSGDRALVELTMEKDPAVRAEIAKIEKALEAIAPALEKPLPTNMKDRIAMRLSFTESKNQFTASTSTEEQSAKEPVVSEKLASEVTIPTQPKPQIEVVEKVVEKIVEKEVKVVQLRTPFLYKAAAVAAIISIGLNGFLAFNGSKSQDKADRLSTINTILATENDSLKMGNAQMEQYKTMLASAQLMVLELQSVNEQLASAKVFCDGSSGMAMINNNSLPMPEEGMQYQVWAIVDGSPVDIGLINTKEDGMPEPMSALKEVHNAQAFAITLEEMGGKPTPNLEKLVVMGKIKT